MSATRILVAGATGYVGGRLLAELAGGDRPVRCLVRDRTAFRCPYPDVEVVEGDCLVPATLPRALEHVDTAFYLVHSLSAQGDFEALDRQAAEAFGAAAARAGVRRIVYLGGLGDPAEDLSPHLRSRHETGHRLAASGVPVVEFRASIVIGAGSLSFEMVRALAERLPVMICPRWVSVKAQPIAVADVVRYLVAALDLPDGAEGVYEIGGPDVVSYGDLIREYARQRGLRRWLVSIPLLTPRLSSLWLTLVTPVQARVGRKLIDGVRNATVVRSSKASHAFTVQPMPIGRAIREALSEEDRSRPQGRSTFEDVRRLVVKAPPAAVFAPVRRIGGKTGWYYGNVLWSLRGVADRLLGGPGLVRHRRDPDTCRAGDTIDCWRVEAMEPNRRLRLEAAMRLPGRAWLTFEVEPGVDDTSRLTLRAEFEPRGMPGRLYWFVLLPVHAVMFRGMIRAIGRLALAEAAPHAPRARA